MRRLEEAWRNAVDPPLPVKDPLPRGKPNVRLLASRQRPLTTLGSLADPGARPKADLQPDHSARSNP
jgi:hypothetical protein